MNVLDEAEMCEFLSWYLDTVFIDFDDEACEISIIKAISKVYRQVATSQLN
jgi:hypothetical protein